MLHNLRQGATDTTGREMRVPAATFTCPDLLSREGQRLFREMPQPVAFAAEVAQPGACLFLQVLDTPLVLTRDDAGTLHAFINACSHRGARVAKATGHSGRLVCPFHGWTYGFDGQLVGRPGERHFESPRQACALRALPVLEECGLVSVGIDPELSRERMNCVPEELRTELQMLDLGGYQPVGGCPELIG